MRMWGRRSRRALVAGWFSYPDRKATFGDVKAKEVLCDWLAETDLRVDVAGERANGVEGVDLDSVDPRRYEVFFFVCGPWREGPAARRLLERFRHCLKIGVDLSLRESGLHGFDHLLERDRPGRSRPDLSFGADTRPLPVAGVVLVHPQPGYGDRQRHERVEAVVGEYLRAERVAPLRLDTLVRDNPAGLASAAQLEALVRRTDVVISSRLHGLVFALKCGVPVVAIDPVAGGAKVSAQARAVDWPLLLDGATVEADDLARAVDRCLDGRSSEAVRRSQERAATGLEATKQELLALLREPQRPRSHR